MPELTVVVPAFRERENIPRLLQALESALEGLQWEAVVVVDDAFDGTEDVVREHAQHDSRVRCLHRIGRRGLASACVEGMLASSAPYLAVIDADLQHDETLVPRLLAAAKSEQADVVVAVARRRAGECRHRRENPHDFDRVQRTPVVRAESLEHCRVHIEQ